MELYRIIAYIGNTSTTFQLAYLPENFEGIKINQNFSFVNPIGYTPKFSIETMRIIEADKTAIDAIFLQYGLESSVEIEIQKLNICGTGYEHLSYFAIDFESYEMFDEYSEFALKSVSVIDDYNKVKNTEIQVPLAIEKNLPTTQKFINYVSLKKEYDSSPFDDELIFRFSENNPSKIYDKDTSLLPDARYIYTLTEKTASKLIIKASGTMFLTFENQIGNYQLTYSISIYKKKDLDDSLYFQKIIFVKSAAPFVNQQINIDFSGEIDTILGDDYNNFMVKIVYSVLDGGTVIDVNNVVLTGEMFLDITVPTNVFVINGTGNFIKYAPLADVLLNIFNERITIPSTPIFSYGLTSANQISKLSDFENIKPKEFLSDLCLMAGLMLNFKIDGTVEIGSITDMFNSLLNVNNAIAITDYKDLSVKHSLELNFASVSVGQEIKEYDMYSYLLDWNKILTFSQANRNASENLDLTLQKFRTDFSGMLDYFYKRSKQQQKTSKDNFIFDPNFNSNSNDGVYLYDHFTPRDMLNNWQKFLSFCFQNFSKNTLTISSNGGTVDNLEISGVAQMDDFVLNETPRLLPIQYNFTCLLDSVDFSEKILKINDKGTDIYLFVINAETTDNLSEQKISGLKIQF